MKRGNPGVDRGYVSIDQIALYKSILNKTGLGKIPSKYGEIGWFGSTEHKTILLDCGCGGKEKCDSPTVYFCLVDEKQQIYNLIVDNDGEFIICKLQNFELQRIKAKFDSLITMLEQTDDKLQEIYIGYDALAKPYIERMMTDMWKLSLEDIEKKHTSDIDDPELLIYVLNSFNSIYWMLINNTALELNEQTWEYKEMIDNGKPIDEVLKLMKSHNIGNHAVQEVLEYSQDLLLAKNSKTIYVNFQSKHIQ